MNIKTRIAALTLATVTVAGGLAASTKEASAWHPHHHHRIGLGFATGAMLGMAAAGAYAAPVYYAGSCRWVRQYNEFGMYVGKRRICSY